MNHWREFLVSWLPYGVVFGCGLAVLRLCVKVFQDEPSPFHFAAPRDKDTPSLRFGNSLCKVTQADFPKNGKQMAIIVKPAPWFPINL
jgi:hypothetical protein